MHCPYCGQQHPDGAKFCNITGQALTFVGGSSQTSQTPPIVKKPNHALSIISGLFGIALLVLAYLFSQGYINPGNPGFNDATQEPASIPIDPGVDETTLPEKASPETLSPLNITDAPTEPPVETVSPEPEDTPVPVVGMSNIPGGTYNMGTTDSEMRWHLRSCNYYASCNIVDYTDMQPMHTVKISPFYMDLHEVTNGEYRTCVEAGVCSQPSQTMISKYLDDNYFVNLSNSDFPVVGVDWDDAVTYCQWNGNKRLPTEAEWEFAASGGKHWFFPWLETPSELSAQSVFGGYMPLSNFCDSNCPMKTWRDEDLSDGWEGPAPVMSFPVGHFGLFDMSGNVSEWIQDNYGEDYYAKSGFENPINSSGSNRLTRGGGWNNGIYHSSSLFRIGQDPNEPASYIGFRCVKDAD